MATDGWHWRPTWPGWCFFGVAMSKGSAIELSRFTDEAVFTSPTVPTVVLVRRGEVIAQAVGDLPASELTRLVAGAIA